MNLNFTEHPNYLNPEIKEILESLIDGTSFILGNNFLGAWLQGSSATGDFDKYSDIDFVIGVAHDLSKEEIVSLQEFHPKLYTHKSHWAKHLEGSYFPVDILSAINFQAQNSGT